VIVQHLPTEKGTRVYSPRELRYTPLGGHPVCFCENGDSARTSQKPRNRFLAKNILVGNRVFLSVSFVDGKHREVQAITQISKHLIKVNDIPGEPPNPGPGPSAPYSKL
jgi:hypothetical protein